MRRWQLSLILSIGLAPAPTIAAEEGPATPFDDWSFSGSLHFSGETRGGSGDPGGQIFGGDETDGFAELDLRMARRLSQFYTWEASAFIAVDESEVRGVKNGVIVERFRTVGQRGDVATPWKLEVGDYFGFLSERTLQRPLKGGRVEIQPSLGGDAFFHSVQAYAGNATADYEDFFQEEADDEVHAGFSWLAEHDRLGALMFAGDYSRTDPTDADGVNFSLAGDTGFDFAGQEFGFESEIAFFDSPDNDPAVNGRGGVAFMAELSGRDEGLSYSTRFEDYDEAYRPPGAAIITDQRFYEGRIGYRFDQGVQLRGRLQHQETERSTANALATATAGVFASLPASESTFGASLTLDAFRRDEATDDRGTKRTSHFAALTAMRGIDADWTGTMRLDGSLTENNGNLVTEDVAFAGIDLEATRSVNFGDFIGSVTPGVQFQVEETAGDDVYAYGPKLGFFLSSETGHDLSVQADLLVQAGGGAGLDAVETSFGGLYSYNVDVHRFAVEADYFKRDPEGGITGDGYRLLLSYTISFDRPAKSEAGDGVGFAGGGRSPFDQVGFVDLTGFLPGGPIAEARAEVERAGRTALFRFGDALVSEDRWLRDIDARQRLVLVERLGRLDRTALLIDLPDGQGSPGDARAFDQIFEIFLKAYGPPSTSISEGNFAPGLLVALREGRFRRIFEWPTAGGVLRLGIPLRLDGAIRVEAIFARTQPPPGQLSWGLQQIR